MKSTTVRALRVVGLGALALVAMLVGCGARAERDARRQAAADTPLRGRMVTTHDRQQLQIDCRGAGAPTVVLESGLDNLGSLSWLAVHDTLARTARVCAYSRSGIMWSHTASTAFASRDAARQLHDALRAAGEIPPWVMVGHSIGGAYVMRFAAMYPDEVKGLVLVDPSHPDQFAAFKAVTGKSLEPSTTIVRVGAALAWTGLLRLLPLQSPPNWPLELRAASAAFLPTSLAALGDEAAAIPATLRDVRTIRDFGSRPIVVLSAANPQSVAALDAMRLSKAQGDRLLQVQHQLHAELAGLSCRGRHQIVPGSSHFIQIDRPNAVVNAIVEVVEAVRQDADTVHRCARG
ncbi:alpha/beta fold hydrolase [Gemmatimonas groenlandica]|uniref:Alpha/beta fold hydrolase n=1 Tax=Gemmatimonas groenlandica TaxID=2732249 RepID=A0A6M4ISU4_9BACT|nr:alpha/beta fold hydrolase [Gemmatimonas groenlandica]QJR37854.1 alpha/beta fold hydrolase [Gemmatimonas groenlandica]